MEQNCNSFAAELPAPQKEQSCKTSVGKTFPFRAATLVTLWYSMPPDCQDTSLDGCVVAPMERDGLVRNKGIPVTGSTAAALLRPLKCNNSASRASFTEKDLQFH